VRRVEEKTIIDGGEKGEEGEEGKVTGRRERGAQG
jgi:hypothetical protein